jgi:hypothetical protein
MVARGEVAEHLAEAKRVRVALGSLNNSSDGGVNAGTDAGQDAS